MNYIERLRANQRLLVEGGLYTPDQLDKRCDNIQAEINSSGETGGLTMADLLHDWLNAPDLEDPDLNPDPVPEQEVDDGKLIIPDIDTPDEEDDDEDEVPA